MAQRISNDNHKEVLNVVKRYLPGVVCWGDSLTYGACESTMQPHPYANRLQTLLSQNLFSQYCGEERIFCPPVVNMGVGGETTLTILGRNGAFPYVLASDLVIPKYLSSVPIEFVSSNGKKVAPLLQDGNGVRGLNPVEIGGIKGVISTGAFWIDPNPKYSFKRLTEGEETVVPKGTPIIASGHSACLDYVSVFFMGQNGGWEDENGVQNPKILVSQIQKAIARQKLNKERFVVVGLHTENKEGRKELEKEMAAAFGDKYINLREYFSSENGVFKDYGLKPNKEDLALMKEGKTPYRFLKMTVDSAEVDATHFLAFAYDIIGDLIYKRMDALGYFDEVKKAFGI